jgi:nicotinate-nucleotide pyrophosphorylase (carboxylating)
LEVGGLSQSILKAERLVLNCMQRMSGIATYTRSLVQIIQGTKAKLLDTRKTTPNFRLAEKWACKIGGATNHRYGLFDMILIKDNHVDFAGGISAALEKAFDYNLSRGNTLAIEIEVRNEKELDEVLKIGGVQRIMLDNFSPEKLRDAIRKIDGRFITEASGGINETTLRAYAETGVDFISVGALTHHIKSLDLSLKAK